MLWACEVGTTIACSRLSVVGDEQKRRRAREKKEGGLSPPLKFLSLPFFARPQLLRAWNGLGQLLLYLYELDAS